MVLPNGASPIKIRSTRYSFGSDGITLIELGSIDPDVKGTWSDRSFAVTHIQVPVHLTLIRPLRANSLRKTTFNMS